MSYLCAEELWSYSLHVLRHIEDINLSLCPQHVSECVHRDKQTTTSAAIPVIETFIHNDSVKHLKIKTKIVDCVSCLAY